LRHAIPALAALSLLTASLASGCRKPEPIRREHKRDPSVDPRLHFPASITDPRALQSDRERDVPIAWLFLPEDPVPTGGAPNVVAAVELPCGFRPAYGTVSPAGVSPLAVRLHALYAGPGSPSDAHCDRHMRAIQYISLQRLRLGDFVVTDAAPRTTSDPPAPSVTLHVVQDNESTPPVAVRRSRACHVGDDASCTAGGVCAQVPGHTNGVCVPPIDPYLDMGRPCEDGSLEITLSHPGPHTTSVAPAPGALRACLRACDPQGHCPSSLECANGVCVPQG
jgi:hypothetical protein